MDKNVVMSRPAISIIVPVYNVEKFLGRCLDSIFKQQFSSVFEVIAVDDCSTDNSLHVLKEYQKREKRLIVIEHEINKKLSCARKTGIRASTGEYIMHVDSDDWLLPNALEDLHQVISKNLVDVLVFNYLRENDLGKQTKIEAIKENKFVTNKNEVLELFQGACWNKIVKRELLDDMIYGNTGLNSEEDLIYSTEILLKSNSIYLSNGIHYAYFLNTNSITYSISPINFLKSKNSTLSQLESIFIKYKPDNYYKDYYLDYFEKWIFLEFAKIHYWYKGNFEDIFTLVKELKKSTIMSKSRTHRLELSIDNKKNCLIEVKKRFGFKMALSIYIKSLFK
jgi:glycosyltransferase involved in cell wall biosynthesis